MKRVDKDHLSRGTIRFFLFAIMGIMISCGLTNAQYVNPLKGDLGVHDPVMIREVSTYRIYFTGNLIGSKRSTDRITWTNTGAGLSSPSWIKTYVPNNNGSDFWAPDISFRNNKYWLYYSVSTFGSNVSAIGLATSPSLANPAWTDQGMVIRSVAGDNYNGIDPNVFQDDDGKTYLLFGSFWSGIKMVEIDSATGKPASGTPAIHSLASHTNGIEGPFLIKWGSYYYLFVSWDRCCQGINSTYKIVAGRATQVNGPYRSRTGVAMTSGGGDVLDTGDAVRKGPGHNGIFIEHDTVFCVNHYYDANANGASRLQIRPLYWDDGYPSFTGKVTGPPVTRVRNAAVRYEPDHQLNLRVAFGLSRPVLAGHRVFTVSGRKVSGTWEQGFRAGRHMPRGLFLIDSMK